MFANGVCMNMANVTITTVIKGVFGGSYCCYGNFPCYENDNNVFTNSWYFDTMIIASSDKEWL